MKNFGLGHTLLALGGIVALFVILGSKSQAPQPNTGIYAATSDAGKITKKDFGDEWPFTVNEGILECRANAVLFTTQGITYAINGRALSYKVGVDIRESTIWAPNPEIPELKKNLGPIITRGLALCK
jgi:Protein of unknown function (DUF2511)